MNPNRRHTTASLLALVLFPAIANATLIDRGGGLIYDTDLNVTWLSDANYARTSGYDGTGRMIWSSAVVWADPLEFAGYSDWRLPITDQCVQYNCTGSEMGHLFYVDFGGTSGTTVSALSSSNLALFSNIAAADYWTATPSTLCGLPCGILAFGFFSGVQTTDAPQFTAFAWAVRDGDVVNVPEPSTILLLCFAIFCLGLFRRDLFAVRL